MSIMELIDVTPEIRRLFLEQAADKRGIVKQQRTLFFSRFDYQNAELKDTEIFRQMNIEEYQFPTQRKYLREICKQLGFHKSGRGASSKGESPWEKAFNWLWNEEFNEWLKLQQNPNIQIPILNDVNWLQVCHTKLENQQQEIRRKASAMGFELDFPPVPLGLVERKQQQRRDEDVDRRDVYQLEKEVIAKIYEHNDFLEQVINQNPTGKNKHIAIVGEPGAGKTTLLSAVASYIKQENKELPIFISLGSLEKMTLEQYLLEKWLPHAMRLVNQDFKPTSEIEEQLKSRFYKSDVWLLLDGVDEMGEFSPGEALRKISQALTDWLGQARVVLTCRLNVWDASLTNNELPGFDTYKTQQFKPEDVDKFIEEWFKCDEDKIQRGDELKAKLREPGKERVYELVTNPLRLSLLCQIFYQSKHSDLPETKAELFGLYTRHLYYWKRELVPQNLTYTLKQELHQALGRLALAGINSDARFRLNESLAVQEMGQDLFNLACDVGWLNLVDRDASSEEAVYAFFHPNFQEYFAALAIDDWRYFLNHIPNNPEKGIYRIFESKWKEVILLWLGMLNIPEILKREFVSELLNFQDSCGGFYSLKTEFLAVECIQEYRDYSEIDFEIIIAKIIKYAFGYFDNRQLHWCFFLRPLVQEARRIIQDKISVQKIKNHLLKLLENCSDSRVRWDIANTLDRIGVGNKIIKTILAAKVTSKLKPYQSEAVNKLVHIIKSSNTINYPSQTNLELEINKNLELFDFSALGFRELIDQLQNSEDWFVVVSVTEQLKNTRKISQLMAIVKLFKPDIVDLQEYLSYELENKHFRYQYIYDIVWHCAQNMTYPDFYRAWHGEPSPLQNLENQFIDTHSLLSQLEPTQKTACISIINTANIQLSDNEHELVKLLCTRIWREGLNLPAKNIPKISDVADLERELLEMTEDVLQKQFLALVFNEIEPKETLINICRKLANAGEIHIALITKQPLEAPLKGFPPNQPTLLSAIQTWISEID
ncbi:NACHT domain-containing protein [Anabaena sp. UHCC 0451]|uniref:NACHT domain-containing protein n=1 Tax=Anabaena sp. UHCC 0451 TaxID=2055235 RepID=UPI002B2190F5|nr:NACHT domain-containing protein [Anabaena sp. UHCC 0451]MEA5575665.1 NACHT domain-containing protein [Anabaena sp. UHCC 0451]